MPTKTWATLANYGLSESIGPGAVHLGVENVQPTKGSVAILKAIAETGSSSDGFLVTSFSGWSGSVHFIKSLSNGLGKNAQTQSKSN